MANIENRFNIVGYRVLYAYSIDDDAHRGYIKIAERIFHLDDDDVELAKDDAMILQEKVKAELPSNSKLEKIWFGIRAELIGEISINARLVYDLAEQDGIPFKSFRAEGKDIWFNSTIDVIDSLIEKARQVAERQEKNRREKELKELSDSKKKKGTAKKVASSSRPARSIRFRPEQQRAIDKTIAHFSQSQNDE